jgi:hypothetical protein
MPPTRSRSCPFGGVRARTSSGLTLESANRRRFIRGGWLRSPGIGPKVRLLPCRDCRSLKRVDRWNTAASNAEHPRGQSLVAGLSHRQSVGALTRGAAFSSHGLRSRNRLLTALSTGCRLALALDEEEQRAQGGAAVAWWASSTMDRECWFRCEEWRRPLAEAEHRRGRIPGSKRRAWQRHTPARTRAAPGSLRPANPVRCH